MMKNEDIEQKLFKYSSKILQNRERSLKDRTIKEYNSKADYIGLTQKLKLEELMSRLTKTND